MPGDLFPEVMGQYVALKKPFFSETDSSYPSTTSVCYNAFYMKEDQRFYQERIVADPRILAGKPVVKGTRIGVDLVLEELAHNPDIHELLAAHPDLTRDDVQACLAYAQAIVTGATSCTRLLSLCHPSTA